MNVVLAVLSVVGTVAVYWAAKRLYRRYPVVLLNPVLVAPLLLIILLSGVHLTYTVYMSGSGLLANLLGPATVAFAIPMHKHFGLLKKHAPELLAGVVVGSVVGLVTSGPVALWLHLNAQTARSLAPHSVTTPFAMAISSGIGGVPTLTAVFVLITGVLGLVISQWVIRVLPIRTTVAQSVLMGMGAHGVGTAKAFALGAKQGTLSSLAMIMAALVTLVVTPAVLALVAP